MRKLFLLLIISFISLVVNAQSRCAEADSLFKKSKFKEALKVIESDIKTNGYQEENAILKAKILMYVDGDKCFEAIQEAINTFPKSAKAYHTRALIYYEMRDLINSVLDDTKALELCTDDTLKFSILLSRSGIYHFMGQLDNSINDIRMAQELKPDNILILNNLSTLLFDKGDIVESEKILLRMKEIDPKFLGVYINLGYQKLQTGKYEEAEKYLLEGLQINAEDSYILNNLGFIQHKLGRSSEGINNINKAIKSDPKNSYCYRNLALIYLDQNNKDKACENIKAALRLSFTSMYGNEMKELHEKHCL